MKLIRIEILNGLIPGRLEVIGDTLKIRKPLEEIEKAKEINMAAHGLRLLKNKKILNQIIS